MLGLDFSLYSVPDVITPDEWQTLWDKDFRVAYAGVWTGNQGNIYAAQSLKNARDVGFHIGAYSALNGVQSGGWHIEKGVSFCWQILNILSFFAIDCELDGITAEMIDDAVGRVRAVHNQPVIYTGKWWWTQPKNLYPEKLWDFSHIPLITAQYDDSPLLHTTQGYDGWAYHRGNILGKQYQGTTELLPGKSFDLNIFSESFPWK